MILLKDYQVALKSVTCLTEAEQNISCGDMYSLTIQQEDMAGGNFGKFNTM